MWEPAAWKPERGRRVGPWGFHTTARELQTCTFEDPGASNTTKIPREDPQREKKSENGGGRGNKKRDILAGSGGKNEKKREGEGGGIN